MNNKINHLMRALLVDYSSVYYVDLKNDTYEQFGSEPGDQKLELRSSGGDFFAYFRKKIQDVVCEEDKAVLMSALSREALEKLLADEKDVSIVYRSMIDGKPVYHTMRVFRDNYDGDECVILAVLNTDASVRTERATKTYNAIAKTLANRYATIYYVDLYTDHYVEYSSSDDYKDLDVPPEGEDFFAESQRNANKFIHEDDKTEVLKIFEKKHITALTRNGRKYYTEYKLVMNGEAHHVRLMAVRADKGESLIIALENIDEEVRQKEELKNISERSVVFSHIAESLAQQYGMIYYIDAETDDYIEFTSTDEYKEFDIRPVGSNFFSTSQRNVSMIAHPADRELLFDALDKKRMLKAVNEKGTFTITYRLMLSQGSGYTRMTVFWANDKKHLIMGIANIDNDMQRENALKKMIEENAVFSQIAESLANQYDTIYYVDMLTDYYIEFSSTNTFKGLDVRPTGNNFFMEAVGNVDRVIHPEDRDAMHRILEKAALIKALNDKHRLTHTYRLIIGENPMYARMSIIWATDNKHVIIGVMNIDSEVRKEREVQEKLSVANEKAYRDELTGVKNKNAYTDFTAQLQASIDTGDDQEFAVVVCDVNGLKDINDRLGHIEGDAYIKRASELICGVFVHSPVFRIGGDEFVVVLLGEDYQNKDVLMLELERKILGNKKRGEVVIAAGIGIFIPGMDTRVANVFERADAVMYKNKAELKDQGI